MSEQWHHAGSAPPSRRHRAVVVVAVLMALVVVGCAVVTVVVGFVSGRFGDGVKAAPGEPITTSAGVEIVAGPLGRVDDEYGGTRTCTTVSYRNGGDRVASYSVLDWNLENPRGETLDFTVVIRSDLLGIGNLAPGASASGLVCFPGYEPGRHELVQENFGLNQQRLVWVDDLR